MSYLNDLLEKAKKQPSSVSPQEREALDAQRQREELLKKLAISPQATQPPVQAFKTENDLRALLSGQQAQQKTEADLKGLLFQAPQQAPLQAAQAPQPSQQPRGPVELAFQLPPSPEQQGAAQKLQQASGSGAIIAQDALRSSAELADQREQALLAQQQAWFEKAKKQLVDSYSGIEVYKIDGEPLLFYKADIVRPTLAERRIINTIREAATRLIAIEPYEIRDPVQRKKVYFSKVLDIIDSASADIQIPRSKREYFADSVVREMIGFGALDKLLEDDNLEDILVIGENRPVYVFHRRHEMMKTNIVFYNDQDILDIIDKIGRAIGRRIDRADPLLDARLPDGSRVNATIPPISIGGSTVSIRKFRADPFSIVDFLNFGTISPDLAAFLWLASDGMNVRPANVLIAGGTGSGKTSMLNVLSSLVPDSERVISIEDTAELQLPIEHWVRFEKRLPSLEGTGEISMAALVKNSLRMRPDRIIVGEVRGEEADTLFTAMNTGHDGSMGTIHANSAAETRVRIISPPMSVPETMLSGLDLIIVQQRIHLRDKGTIRRVVEVAEVSGVLEGESHMDVIYKWNPATDAVERTALASRYLQKLQEFTGMTREEIEQELDARKDVLMEMKKQRIRTVRETASIAKRYLMDRILKK